MEVPANGKVGTDLIHLEPLSSVWLEIDMSHIGRNGYLEADIHLDVERGACVNAKLYRDRDVPGSGDCTATTWERTGLPWNSSVCVSVAPNDSHVIRPVYLLVSTTFHPSSADVRVRVEEGHYCW